MSPAARKPFLRVSDQATGSNIYHPVQSQKKARILKFWVKEEEELYYMCSYNKGAFVFCIGKNPVYSQRGSYEFDTNRKNGQRNFFVTDPHEIVC